MPGSIKIDDGSGNYTILTNAGSLGSDKTITIPNETGTLATAISKTSYTPTFRNLTLGNGTVTGEYAQVGDLVFVNMELTWGSTTSITSSFITMSVPVTPDFSGFRGMPNAVELVDSGTATYYGHAKPYNVGGTSEVVLQVVQTTGSLNKIVEITSSSPFTWTTNDAIIVQLVYLAG